MKLSILPKTKYGKRSTVFLLYAFVALIFVGIKALMGQPFPEVVALLHIMIIGTLALNITSLNFGIKAIRKAEERSLVVIGVILIDILAVILLSIIFLGLLATP